nr:hypothetical protein [Methyloceanibacter stevinii]
MLTVAALGACLDKGKPAIHAYRRKDIDSLRLHHLIHQGVPLT